MKSTLVLAIPFLAACGSRQYYVMEPPKQPFSAFASVEVKPFSIDGLDALEPGKRLKAMELATYMAEQLRERLAPHFPGGGRKLVVNGKLVGFAPGSQALRYWVGFGAGAGEIVAEVAFDAEDGAQAKAMGKGSVSGGWFGGGLNSAGKRVAKAIVDFVDANHAAVIDRERHPGLK